MLASFIAMAATCCLKMALDRVDSTEVKSSSLRKREAEGPSPTPGGGAG